MNESAIAAEAAQKAQDVLPLSEQFWTEALKLGAVGFIAVAFMMLFASFLIWGSRSLYDRLFDKDNGLVTLLVNDHRAFISETSSNVKSITRSIRSSAKTSVTNDKQIISGLDRLMLHAISHQSAKEDWLLTICRLLRKFAYQDGVSETDVEPIIKEIEDAVHSARQARTASQQNMMMPG